MKQFLIGLVLGSVVTGTGAFAFTNPLADLPIQTQVDKLMIAVDAQFNNISQALELAQGFFNDIDQRLTVIETKLKIKRD